jgi:hypothetical protein
LRERAVRLVAESRAHHELEWAITSVAASRQRYADEQFQDEVSRVNQDHDGVYGARKGVAGAQRGSHPGSPLHGGAADARAGASRRASGGVGQLTTISDPVAARPADLLLYADDIAQLPVFTELARLADALAGGRRKTYLIGAATSTRLDGHSVPLIVDETGEFQSVYGATGGTRYLVHP